MKSFISAPKNFGSSSSSGSESLDLATLFKASQAISREIELNKILETFLNIIQASVGTDRGSLLLQTEQELEIVARLESGQNPEILTIPIPLEGSEDVPIRLVNKVKHSLEPLILADARDDIRFAGDRYLQKHQPQSVLCSPILYQGKLLGILYLENRLTHSVFKRDRLELLTILCSQAAISLENARLFNREQAKAQALQSSLEQLQQSELRFQNLFEKSTDAILLLSADGFVDCNLSAVKLFGYRHKSQFFSHHPAQFSPKIQPDGQSSLEKADFMISLALAAGHHRFEWMHQRANQELFWAEVVLTPISFEGKQILHSIVRDISDRKAIEEALRQSEARYAQLASNIPAALYQFEVTVEGIYRLNYVSSRFSELFDVSVADVLGDISIFLDRIVPEDRELFSQTIQNSAISEQPWVWEGRFLMPRGGIKWVRGESSPKYVSNGSIIWDGILTDVTDRKNAESKLEFTQFAVDHSADGIAWLLPNGSFAYGNQAMCRNLGYSYAEFCTLYVWDIDDSALIAPQAWSAHWQHLKATGGFSIESRHRSKDGNHHPVELSLNYFEFEGEEYNFVQVRNITERMRLEAERKQAEVDLRTMNQQLETTIHELQHATKLKDEFLATMSHELRTPLNAILGMSEILQEKILGAINERQLKSLAMIERSGQHLLSLINDILDVSKISAGTFPLSIQPVPIHELIDSSLALIRQQANDKQIRLEVQLRLDADFIVVDQLRMRQVLINLLNNAIKFTPPTGLVMLSVTQQNTTGELKFSVTDTGIGIAAQDQAKLFEPFVQVDSGLNRRYEGTGLGLALVKQIVDLHGGSIDLESELDQGSCFIVSLPQPCSISEAKFNKLTLLN